MANNLISSIQYNSGDIGVFTIPYGVCSTAASTAAKTVDAIGDFALASGARILVKFTITNTASNPTLNVDGSGAKNIYYNGAAITANYLTANKFLEFVYDGTQWQLIGDVDTDTHYTSKNIVGASTTATANAAVTGNGVYLNHLEQSSVKSTHKITGSGTVKVTSDSSGNITINSPAVTAESLGLGAALRFIGVTSTTLEDGSTTNPIIINQVEVTATIGSVVLDSNKTKEYVWTGSEWEMLGASNSYALANHKHTVTHKPEGTISKPSFTGSAVATTTPNATNQSTSVASTTHTHSVTVTGTNSAPAFTGTPATIPESSAKDSVSVAEHTHSVTVAGTVSKPTFTGSAVTSGNNSGSAVKAATAVGASSSIENYRLTISASVTATGDAAPHTHTHSVTAAGSISQPTWSQSSGSASAHTSTQAVEVSLATHTHSYTPVGSVAAPTWTQKTGSTGAPASGTSSNFTSVASTSHTHNVTAAGDVSQPTFTGSSATLTTSEPTSTPNE